MSYNDPYGYPPGSGDSGQPYMGQQPQFNSPDSFTVPMVPGSPYFHQRPNRRRGPRLGCLITLVIVIALLLISYTSFARNWPIFGPTTITVKAHPTLVINSQRYEQQNHTPGHQSRQYPPPMELRYRWISAEQR